MPSSYQMHFLTSTKIHLDDVGTKAKFWFAGNGDSPYTVDSAFITQGGVVLPVTCGGGVVNSTQTFSGWKPTKMLTVNFSSVTIKPTGTKLGYTTPLVY